MEFMDLHVKLMSVDETVVLASGRVPVKWFNGDIVVVRPPVLLVETSGDPGPFFVTVFGRDIRLKNSGTALPRLKKGSFVTVNFPDGRILYVTND